MKQVENKKYKAKVEDRLLKGLKPHVVEITLRGRIDGACKGGNAWDDFVKSMAPRTLMFLLYMSRTKTLQTWQHFKSKWIS
jgi:hypothetical protein